MDKFGNALLCLAGIKLYADGTLGGWTAYFPEGYRDDPCRTGSLYHEPAEYRALVAKAHTAGLQTATHAQSPTAIQLVLDAVSEALSVSPRPDARHRIEHCGLPTLEQIARMAELGISPSTSRSTTTTGVPASRMPSVRRASGSTRSANSWPQRCP